MNEEVKKRIEDISNGIVPEGYKKTKMGIVPAEWDELRFREIFSRIQRRNNENNSNVLTISAQYGLINQGEFFNKEVASEDKSTYYLLNKGEWAYNKSYSSGYPFGALKRLEMYEKGIVSPLYICFAQTNKNKCPDYYLQYFEGGLMNKEIKAIAQEGARNHGLLNMGIDDFFNTFLIEPPQQEQERIAEILKTQDKVIELKEKLLAEKQREKKYLMQQLLTGKTRLKGFSNEWGRTKINKLIFEVDERTTLNNQYEILSVTKEGIEKQSEHFNRQIASTDNTGYKIIRYNQLALSILNLWLGSIDVLKISDIGIISPAYKVFDFNEGSMIPDFGRYFMRSYNMVCIYNSCSEQGASVVRKNLDITALLNIEVAVPSILEQKAIADIFSTKDKEIELIKKQIEVEKQKKKSLMQLLLTGIVRVG